MRGIIIMTIKGLLFDLYGTLIDIETDEGMEEIYRSISHFLNYHEIYLHRRELKDRYYEIMKEQKEDRNETHPEIDVEAIWDTLLRQEGMEASPARQELSVTLAQLYRGISRKRLQLYSGVKETLDELRLAYPLALVSDAQPCFAIPEIKAAGLGGYFDPIIISAYYGFRKPDPRLIEKALRSLKLLPSEVIYVGNDMYRDIYGATLLGIRTIFFDSNQGQKSYEGITPDYYVSRFEDVVNGVKTLSQQADKNPPPVPSRAPT
jgi:putative hydrolase of the HAD superfamily